MIELEAFRESGLDAILRWAATEELSYGYEQSVKFGPGMFEKRRGLLSFSNVNSNAGMAGAVLQTCRQMSAPEHIQQSIRRFYSAAAFCAFWLRVFRLGYAWKVLSRIAAA